MKFILIKNFIPTFFLARYTEFYYWFIYVSTLQQNHSKHIKGLICEEIAILKPHSIVLYNKYVNRKPREFNEESSKNLKKGKDGKYNGFMSPNTSRKVKKYLENWLLALKSNLRKNRFSNYYPTFVTLTLPSKQKHSDNEIKRVCLNHFIIKLKRVCQVKYYFWRAEPQKNGNIHFHLIVDKFINHDKIRVLWNEIINKLGYVDEYSKNQKEFFKNGFKMFKGDKRSKQKQYAIYCRNVQEGFRNPNSTDIHGLRNVRSLTSYVCKYVTKTDTDSRMIKGRIWGCSDELRSVEYSSGLGGLMVRDEEGISRKNEVRFFEDQNFTDYFRKVCQEVGSENVNYDEYFTVVKLPKPQEFYLKKFDKERHRDYLKHYQKVFNQLYKSDNPSLSYDKVEESPVISNITDDVVSPGAVCPSLFESA